MVVGKHVGRSSIAVVDDAIVQLQGSIEEEVENLPTVAVNARSMRSCTSAHAAARTVTLR